MSLTPGQKVRGTFAGETAVAIIVRFRPWIYTVLSFAAGAVVAWMFGGCASMTTAVDMTSAPLGIQAGENYIAAHQSRPWVSYRWRF